jgi:Caspase domain
VSTVFASFVLHVRTQVAVTEHVDEANNLHSINRDVQLMKVALQPMIDERGTLHVVQGTPQNLKAQVLGQIDAFVATVNAGDAVLLYFNGHGFKLHERSYIAMADFPTDNTTLQALMYNAEHHAVDVMADAVHKLLADEARRPSAILVLVDACFSYFVVSTEKMKDSALKKLQEACTNKAIAAAAVRAESRVPILTWNAAGDGCCANDGHLVKKTGAELSYSTASLCLSKVSRSFGLLHMHALFQKMHAAIQRSHT